MTIEEQLREYRATLDAATEEAAVSHANHLAPPAIRIRPTRSLVLAVVAVAATVAVAFAVVGASHHNATTPAGTAGSTSVPPPTTIAPPSRIVLPDVVGMNRASASSTLESFGFHATMKTVSNCAAPAGLVVVQNPAPGQRVAEASTVTLDVCDGGIHPRGVWTESRLTITPSSLGAVRVGMTKSEAQTASGVAFGGTGDGFVYPTKLPAGYPHDYVGLAAPNDTVVCVGASIFDQSTPPRPQTSTPEGVRLGDSVQQLIAVYGTRAHFVPAPKTGMTTNAGYVVAESGGNLVFVVNPAQTKIVGIAGGGSDLGPNSCTG